MARSYGSQVALEANGASVANNAFGAADDAGFSLATDGGGRSHIEFELEITFGTAPTANTPVVLHHAPQDFFGGANDAAAPSSTNLGGWLASVIVDSATTTQRFRFDVLNAPANSKYWIQNAGTGQTISSAWKLSARAWDPA